MTGQDGSYLAELLLEKGYEVFGMTRRSSVATDQRIAHIAHRLRLIPGDLLDEASLVNAVRTSQPDEIYNLAAQSFVPTSWNQPVLTGELTGGAEFVSRKVSLAAARIAQNMVPKGRRLNSVADVSLRMGNLDAERDWGFAGDYVRAMWLMLQADKPADYVIGTGVTHSVRDLCRIAFERVGLDYRDHVTVDPDLYRPAEVDHLRADASKARRELGWESWQTFSGLVESMVDADLPVSVAA